jgi:hypothetical protein
MSLTSHLREKASPVREWFLTSLATTRPTVLAGNDALCGSPRSPPLLAPPEGCDRALSGTAVDYLIRVSLARNALDHTVSQAGAELVDRRGTGAGVRLHREAVAVIESMAPWHGLPPGDDLLTLCRMCLVLARFEQFFRAGLRVWTHVGEPLSDRPPLKVFADRVVPPTCLRDLVGMAAPVIEDHADLRHASPLVLNPVFDLSVALGGADADVIAGRTLWELKSSARVAGVFSREDLWQLLGYALADQSDAYDLAGVGIAALRRRERVRWDIAVLLADLSGESRSLERWRAEFARAVSTANQQGLDVV